MPGLKPHTWNIRGPRVIPRGLRRYFSDNTHARVYFLPVSVCDTGPPLSHKEISVAGQKAEPGSGANGYYMDPGRGGGHQPVRDYKLGLRTLGPSLDSFLDSSKCALIILVTHLGRGSNNEPRDRAWTRPRGMSFFLVTGQQ